MNGKNKFIYEQYWHERSRGLKDHHGKEKTTNEIFDCASSVLKEGEKILDVGCGDGHFSQYIQGKFKEIHGAEIAEEAAHIAQRRSMFVSLLDINESLPYKDKTFSAVSCLDVIEHLFDPVSVLKEICRVLRPNGQLVLTTPNIRYFRNLYKLICRGVFPHTSSDTFIWGGGHLHYFTRKDLSVLLKMAGFKKIDFYINQGQFRRSKKRNLIRFLIGEKCFGEWFCGSITVSAHKES